MPETGEGELPCTIRIGDEAWVKPPQGKFKTEWNSRHETSGKKNASVNEMPHYILDIHTVIILVCVRSSGGSEEENYCKVDSCCYLYCIYCTSLFS